VKLLDLNVWLAGSWARHRHHDIVKVWVDQQIDELVFCRVTQMGLLRLITNPAITGRDALSRRQAWDAVDGLMADSRVRFLSEPETRSCRSGRRSPRRITTIISCGLTTI
jgi:predicted nucleic acid-binding protein